MLSTENSLYKACLSSQSLLGWYREGSIPTADEIRSHTFLTVRELTGYKPDYIYKNAWDRLLHNPSHGQILSTCISKLAKYYLRSDGENFVVPVDRFHEWQHIILTTSPLLLVVAAIREDCCQKVYGDPQQCVQQITFSALPTIDCRSFNQLLSRKGLSEVHMHLNGTTEADKVWLDALEAPEMFYSALNESFNGQISEQLKEVSGCLEQPSDLLRILYAARYVREKMAERLFRIETKPVQEGLTIYQEQFSRRWLCEKINKESTVEKLESKIPSNIHPLVYYQPKWRAAKPLAQEGILLSHVLQAIKSGDEILAAMFHFYILSQSCFCSLLIQQERQSGFDQFQRIADNKLRDPSEVDYTYRFAQLFEHLPGKDNHLEGRYAPKASIEKSGRLLQSICSGWKRFQDGNTTEKDAALSLTAHFIKKPDKAQMGCRHHVLRREIMAQGVRIAFIRKVNHDFEGLMTSVDAAANELHAGPEVFAPIYRFMRAKGCKRFTYHVGEDFHHLLSGLRAIWEAIHFLELRSGDRIGHGTALGIDPVLWQRRLGETVTLSKEEWLDDLLFVYSVLLEESDGSALAARVSERARELAAEIYGKKWGELYILRKAWKLRKLDPLVVLDPSFEKRSPVSAWITSEKRICNGLQKELPDGTFDFYRRYHLDKGVRERGQKLIDVKSDEISAQTLSCIQNRIIRTMRERQIAMEVMPSSNVRISVYDDYNDHHIFRLLGLTENGLEQIPTMCIASDDPGIFASCLQNEYAHVFKGLLDYGLSEQDALGHIERLIDNAWAFRFKPSARGEQKQKAQAT